MQLQDARLLRGRKDQGEAAPDKLFLAIAINGAVGGIHAAEDALTVDHRDADRRLADDLVENSRHGIARLENGRGRLHHHGATAPLADSSRQESGSTTNPTPATGRRPASTRIQDDKAPIDGQARAAGRPDPAADAGARIRAQ
ncbi:MAG: hypothetical protein NTV19_00665 [Burkholderiales bacterium]|nr:hypothetical protein [Burkholderiales bacterium]